MMRALTEKPQFQCIHKKKTPIKGFKVRPYGVFDVLDQDVSSEMESRNDADILGVRRGCTFIGYSNANFDSSAGNFVLTSGATDR